MNPPIHLKTITLPLLIAFALGCFALSPALQAAPPPNPQPTQNVNVVNTPNVRDVDNPAKSPFTFTALLVVSANSTFASTNFQVPASKRLVIEQVSVSMQPGEDMTAAAVSTRIAGSEPVTYWITGTVGAGISIASAQLRCYADGGTQVGLEARRNQTIPNETFGDFNVSGYLVDMP
jgi:hypothetical protein